jgi:hypothetical protein
VDKIKNIDGKVISSSHSLEGGSEKGIKEVEFRKSIFASQEKETHAIPIGQKPK